MPLTLLTRDHCGLCDDFVEAFAAAEPALFATLQLVDVDRRADWKQLYGLRIPVLLDAAGTVIGEGRFDARQLAGTARR